MKGLTKVVDISCRLAIPWSTRRSFTDCHPDGPLTVILIPTGRNRRRPFDGGLVARCDSGASNVALTDLDRKLLKQCLNQTPGAWQDFVDRFIGLFVHVINHTAHARSVVIGPADIDDLCSDVFLTLLKDDFAILRNFRGESSLATYLTIISRRVVVREIVRRRRSEALGHVSARQANVDAVRSNGSEIDRIEAAEDVQRMLSGLPSHEADVIRQFHLEGKSYREISGALGIPENSIGPTLSRARDRLRQSRLKTGA